MKNAALYLFLDAFGEQKKAMDDYRRSAMRMGVECYGFSNESDQKPGQSSIEHLSIKQRNLLAEKWRLVLDLSRKANTALRISRGSEPPEGFFG
jgi:hypothetical protein